MTSDVKGRNRVFILTTCQISKMLYFCLFLLRSLRPKFYDHDTCYEARLMTDRGCIDGFSISGRSLITWFRVDVSSSKGLYVNENTFNLSNYFYRIANGLGSSETG